MDSGANFRNAVINEPRIFGPQQSIHTAAGRVALSHVSNGMQQTQRAPQSANNVPPIPPKPYGQQQMGPGMGSMYPSPMGMYGTGMYGNGMYGNSMYGNSYGGMMNPYNRYGNYPSMYTGFNNRMCDPMDPESRFIQIAEESSRPAFQSIESLVMAIGNIASMLDSTFFALTSSFRAILGVAANFGQLRGVFAQFWSTFAVIRGLSWLYKKLIYMLGLSKVDPSHARFSEIFASVGSGGAQKSAGPDGAGPGKKVSAWPILTFLALIFATPYLIMKLIGQVSTTALEESRNPQTWIRPFTTEAMYPFKASNPSELTVYSGQLLKLAPREVQQTHKLLNTGWALATIDDETSGLVPINYLRRHETANAKQAADAAGGDSKQSEAESLLSAASGCMANDKPRTDHLLSDLSDPAQPPC